VAGDTDLHHESSNPRNAAGNGRDRQLRTGRWYLWVLLLSSWIENNGKQRAERVQVYAARLLKKEADAYSDRSAIIGCSAAARRAGTQLAIRAAPTMTTATEPMAAKSIEPMP
jgi:hypothetical protein